MALVTRQNQNVFYRNLYHTWHETSVTLLKRNNDQQQGTVVSYLLFNIRRRQISHTGEPIQGSMGAGDFVEWMFPMIELQRVGLNNINALDRIVDNDGQTWQPEAPDTIRFRLGKNYISVSTRRADPPAQA